MKESLIDIFKRNEFIRTIFQDGDKFSMSCRFIFDDSDEIEFLFCSDDDEFDILKCSRFKFSYLHEGIIQNFDRGENSGCFDFFIFLADFIRDHNINHKQFLFDLIHDILHNQMKSGVLSNLCYNGISNELKENAVYSLYTTLGIKITKLSERMENDKESFALICNDLIIKTLKNINEINNNSI